MAGCSNTISVKSPSFKISFIVHNIAWWEIIKTEIKKTKKEGKIGQIWKRGTTPYPKNSNAESVQA